MEIPLYGGDEELDDEKEEREKRRDSEKGLRDKVTPARSDDSDMCISKDSLFTSDIRVSQVIHSHCQTH